MCLIPTLAAAQAPAASPAQREAMEKLGFLVGSWQGTGKFIMGPNMEQPMTSAEEVTPQLGGLLLAVEGRHRARFPGQDTDTLVHHAFAVINALDDGTYRIRAYLVDGQSVDAEGHVESNAFIWGFRHPTVGLVRYHIHLSDDGQWIETGERSTDGETWTKYLTLALDKR
jgi:hypothetical protein